MMKRTAIAIILAAGIGMANPVELGVGARAQGMGGAFMGISDDATAIYWNPAGLSTIKSTQINLNHWMFQDIKDVMIEYAGFAHTMELVEGNKLGIGLGMLSKWASLEEGNPDYGLSRKTIFSDNTLQVSAGAYILSYLQVGLTLDRYWVTSDIGGKSGLGFDLGLKGEIYGTEQYHVYYGAIFRNLMAGMGDEKYTPTGRIGFAVYGVPLVENGKTIDHYVKVAVDVAEKDDINGKKGMNFHYYAGLEITPVKYVSIRAGYNDVYQYSGGIGARYDHFELNYAYSGGNNIFGDAHRIGMAYNF